jgi:hypothetical protein
MSWHNSDNPHDAPRRFGRHTTSTAPPIESPWTPIRATWCANMLTYQCLILYFTIEVIVQTEDERQDVSSETTRSATD